MSEALNVVFSADYEQHQRSSRAVVRGYYLVIKEEWHVVEPHEEYDQRKCCTRRSACREKYSQKKLQPKCLNNDGLNLQHAGKHVKLALLGSGKVFWKVQDGPPTS